MTNEYLTVALCCLVVILVAVIYIFNKKASTEKNNVLLSFTALGVNILIEYINTTGPEDVKQFDEFSDYIIFIKNFLFKEISDKLLTSSSSIKKIMNDKAINTVLDNVIDQESRLLEETFKLAKEGTFA